MVESLASLENAPELESYKLSNVRPNGRTLGTGSYGFVIELDMQGARCAGKQLHGILMEQPGHVTEKFASECRLMSSLRHPHIVQFLGLWFQRVTREGVLETIPVLVMEYLPYDLDRVLGRHLNLPIALKISILHDIAKGLAYLHLRDEPIIHRDLSARNVLLDSAMVAKIADFGVARRIVAEIQGNRVQSLTAFPGTVAYMPPEVNERYNEKIDIFSYGVLILYAIIQQLPSDIRPATYTDESGQLKPRTEIERRLRYVQQAYEILADEQKPEHKLLKLMEQCLQTDYQQRPNVELLLTELEDLGRQVGSVGSVLELLELLEALRTREERSPAALQEAIDSQKAEIEFRDARIAQLEDTCISQSREVERLEEEARGGADSVRLQLEEQLRETQTELDSKQRELEVVTVQMQRQEQDLISQLEAKEQESRGLWEDIQRKDGKLGEQQEEIQRYMDAVQLQDRRFRAKEIELETVRQRMRALEDEAKTLKEELLKKNEQLKYLRSEHGPEVNSPTTPVLPNPSPQSWTPPQPSGLRVTLPISWLPCAPLPFGMNRPHATGTGNRQNSKVVIGGGVAIDDDGKRVAFYDEKTDRWTEFGRYPLKLFAIALLNEQLLLVGGYDKTRDEYSGNICTWNRRFWDRTYTPMPTPRSEATAVGYEHWLVVAGGVNRGRSVLTTVEVLDSTSSQWSTVEPLPYGCAGMQSAVYLHPSSPNLSTWYLLGSMEELRHRKVSFCVSLSSLVQSSEGAGAGVWKLLPEPPFSCSGVVVMRGYLLAVGGKDRQSQRKSEVYIYLPGTCEWLHVASLPVARHSCSCALLSEGKFLVIGGRENTERSRTVLLGSVTFSAA